ncbi:MAG: RnfABCDGE type electron transport complex subunit A [Bacilli bacterium]|nr:RnfABCDGE type electron transport complex subunit A [Bacilli bacterium]
MSLITLFFTSILVENIILTKFLGLCPFLGMSNKEEGALSMGIAITVVMTIASFITYLIYHYLLIPYDIEYLKVIVFILVIASIVQIMEILIRKFLPKVYDLFGIYLPLITTNCAILGVVLLNTTKDYNLLESLVFALGSSMGYMLVLYIFSNIRERIEDSPIPKAFKGIPIALITAGIIAIIFGRYM